MPQQLDPGRPARSGAFGTLVVGVDGQVGGWEALVLARRFAAPDAAGLVVVCAYPDIATQHAKLVWPDIAGESDAQAVLDLARARLVGSHDVTFVAAAGITPGTVLQRMAVEYDADLLVMGCSRRAELGRVLGGDVVRQTLDDPPCPVAVAPRGPLDATAPFCDIGVAVDGTAHSLAAVRWARALTPTPHLARMVELISVDPDASEPVPEDERALDHLGDEHAREAFAALRLVGRPEAPAQVSWRNAAGPVAEALEEISPQLDLLVVGTHGRGPLGRLLRGGIAADVADGAGCPVVAVPCAPPAVDDADRA